MAEIFTVDDARLRLDDDIAKAHERYRKRVARIDALKKSPEPGTSSGGKNWAKYEQARTLRSQGATLREVGQAMGLSASRVREMIQSLERRDKFIGGQAALSTRSCNVLRDLLGLRFFTRVEASGLTIKQVSDARNCGASTLNEIRLWLQKEGMDLRPR